MTEYNELSNIRSSSSDSVSLVVYSKYKDRFVYIKKKLIWKEFNGYRWVDNSVYNIKTEIVKGLGLDIRNYISLCMLEAENLETDENVKQVDLYSLYNKVNICSSILKKLTREVYINKLVKACAKRFNENGFLKKLDSKNYLIGFNNGVYDLKTHTFRRGCPNDYISLSTNTNFIGNVFTEEHQEEYNNMCMFIEQILPVEEDRDNVISWFSQCLHGKVSDTKLQFWYGPGSNGKKSLYNLFRATFGDYCCELPFSVLNKLRQHNRYNFIKTKGKRCGLIKEPIYDNIIELSKLKELTSTKTIGCKMFFKNTFESKFKTVLIINKSPVIDKNISMNDLIHYFNLVEFNSIFIDEPKNENEYLKDDMIITKIEEWKEIFMVYLLEKYRSLL